MKTYQLCGSYILATSNDHFDPVPWPQRDQRLRLDVLPGDQLEGNMLHQRSQDQMSFHEREMVADADARPIPERQGVTGQVFLVVA